MVGSDGMKCSDRDIETMIGVLDRKPEQGTIPPMSIAYIAKMTSRKNLDPRQIGILANALSSAFDRLAEVPDYNRQTFFNQAGIAVRDLDHPADRSQQASRQLAQVAELILAEPSQITGLKPDLRLSVAAAGLQFAHTAQRSPNANWPSTVPDLCRIAETRLAAEAGVAIASDRLMGLQALDILAQRTRNSHPCEVFVSNTAAKLARIARADDRPSGPLLRILGSVLQSVGISSEPGPAKLRMSYRLAAINARPGAAGNLSKNEA